MKNDLYNKFIQTIWQDREHRVSRNSAKLSVSILVERGERVYCHYVLSDDPTIYVIKLKYTGKYIRVKLIFALIIT